MSALWLMLPLVVMGIGEGFHFPGTVVALYYQEFPKSLKKHVHGYGVVVDRNWALSKHRDHRFDR